MIGNEFRHFCGFIFSCPIGRNEISRNLNLDNLYCKHLHQGIYLIFILLWLLFLIQSSFYYSQDFQDSKQYKQSYYY